MRIPIIAGNWKMNLTLAQASELVRSIHVALRDPGDVDVVVAPTFISLSSIVDITQKSFVDVAAQNLHPHASGAFTGEVSAEFIKDAGANYVIVGHSERRQYFNESNQFLNQKLQAANRVGLKPIYCVGETLEEREAGREFNVIGEQLIEALQKVDPVDLIIAYEPVWAIGTGKTATAEQVEKVHRFIRGVLSEIYDSNHADRIRIQYGGSVKPANAKQLLGLPNVDGALVGGAALKYNDFVEIIKAAHGG